MSVISPARPATKLADYNELKPLQRKYYDRFMEQADNTRDASEYNLLMAAAALAAGIELPHSGDITTCACPNCLNCGAIFDPDGPGLREVEPSGEYNLPRLQCADCADEHPVPHED
ncbi:hypothetical protein [Streptomyces roseoviridis]|uniref:Ferredoxin n=1 Tax=Streptomyces roseoviridis TaxID=67361 RepID=A0ABV5QYI6_9ACTN